MSRSRPAWTSTVIAAMLICVAAVGTAARYGVSPGARLRMPQGFHVGAKDEVVMLDRYFYELPFYWHLRRPMRLLGDWTPGHASSGDDWRGEVSDAARFEPATAAQVLIGPSDLPRLLCRAPVTWLVGESPASLVATGLNESRSVLVARNDRMVVWRIDGTVSGATACRPESIPGGPPASMTPAQFRQ